MICLLTFIEECTVGPWQRSTEPSSLFPAPFLWNGLSWKAWLVLVYAFTIVLVYVTNTIVT